MAHGPKSHVPMYLSIVLTQGLQLTTRVPAYRMRIISLALYTIQRG